MHRKDCYIETSSGPVLHHVELSLSEQEIGELYGGVSEQFVDRINGTVDVTDPEARRKQLTSCRNLLNIMESLIEPREEDIIEPVLGPPAP